MRRSASKKPRIVIAIERRSGRVHGLMVSGHAGFAPAGRDVVCAGISALVLSAANGLRRHCGVTPNLLDDPAGAYVVSLPRGGNAKAQAVLETAISGIRAIAAAYPGYVVLREQRSARWTR